jgi:hypothetical protein
LSKVFTTISIDKVLANKKLPNWILKGAFELKTTGFLPAGNYFEDLDDVEVHEIKNALDAINTSNYKQFEVLSQQSEEDIQNLTLLCFILAVGEGELEINSEMLSDMLKYLFLLINIEYSHRECKVDVIRNNYSIFGGNKPAVKLKE